MTTPDGEDPDLTRPVPDVDDPTVSIADDSPTMTGPTIGSWPSDATDVDLPAEFGPLVWNLPHTGFGEHEVRERGNTGYYVSLTIAVLLAIGLVATLTVLAISSPTQHVAGTPAPQPRREKPAPTESTESTSRPAPTTKTDPLADLAEHELSSSTTQMGQQTCALPKFDPADAAQETFYQAAKTCADAAWRTVFPDAGAIEVQTVYNGPTETQCGSVSPDSPATNCAGTVYMTPAHLRDGEGNDRYPGRYFGVFLREYAGALQYRTGLAELYDTAREDSSEDLEQRLLQQRTCLAGITSGAMAGLGAVDTNITKEIRDRLTTVDAPAEAATWLEKGFTQRQPAACDTWT